MNHDFQESRAYAEHLLSEHRRVHGLVNRIGQQWSVASGRPVPPHIIAELCEGLEELRGELERHFAEEEAGGVLEEAVARVPELGRQEVRLEEEHPALLGELDRIIAGTRTAAEVRLIPHELKLAFGSFVENLHAHETAENQLLERGFQIEIS